MVIDTASFQQAIKTWSRGGPQRHCSVTWPRDWAVHFSSSRPGLGVTRAPEQADECRACVWCWGGDPCCFRLSASRRGRKPQPGGRASRVLLTEGALCRPAGFVAGCGFGVVCRSLIPPSPRSWRKSRAHCSVPLTLQTAESRQLHWTDPPRACRASPSPCCSCARLQPPAVRAGQPLTPWLQDTQTKEAAVLHKMCAALRRREQPGRRGLPPSPTDLRPGASSPDL